MKEETGMADPECRDQAYCGFAVLGLSGRGSAGIIVADVHRSAIDGLGLFVEGI